MDKTSLEDRMKAYEAIPRKTMDELIEKFKEKGIDEQDAEALAKRTVDLSKMLGIPIEQAFEKALAIITIAMAD